MARCTEQDCYEEHTAKEHKRPFDIRFADKLTLGPLWRHGNKAFGGMTGLPKVTTKSAMLRSVRMPMRDGTILMADIIFAVPKKSGGGAGSAVSVEGVGLVAACPTVVIRTPYNRKFLTGLATTFAIRGYHVVLQDTRGTCESGGSPEVLALEHVDGADTVRWIRSQAWFSAYPKVAMWGVSFLGIVQYAALAAGAELDAMVPICAASDLYSVLRPGNGYALSLVTRWHYFTCAIDPNMSFSKLIGRINPWATKKGCRTAFNGALCDWDTAIAGAPSGGRPTPLGAMIEAHIQDPPDCPFWQVRTYKFTPPLAGMPAGSQQSTPEGSVVGSVCGSFAPSASGPVGVTCLPAQVPVRYNPPVHIVGGWYDIFLRESLNDYARLRLSAAPSREVMLTIGPWGHFDVGPAMTGLREGIWFLERVLKGVATSGGEEQRLVTPGEVIRSNRQQPLPFATVAAPDPFDPTLSVVKAAPHRGARRRAMVYFVGTQHKRRNNVSPWVEFDEFPPPAQHLALRLGSHQRLLTPPNLSFDNTSGTLWGTCRVCTPAAACAKHTSDFTVYTYSAANPAPTIGGVDFGHDAGKKDLRVLEARDDVISFTSARATAGISICGMVSASIAYDSSVPSFDIVIRLTRVLKQGRQSLFTCEGYQRVNLFHVPPGADGRWRGVAKVDMWATAFHLHAGEALRVSICGASNPKYVRNFCSADVDIWTAHPTQHSTCSHNHDIRIVHGSSSKGQGTSWVVLPVLAAALF